MSVTIPTTGSGNISFYGPNGTDGIFSLPNPQAPQQSNESLRDLMGYDWFHGPVNGNTVNFYGWGNYTGTSGTAGDSRIYGMAANSANNNQRMALPAGLAYFYDSTPPGPSTTYYSSFYVDNQLGFGPPPPPPTDNSVAVNLYFGNPFGNFPYLSGNGNVGPGTNQTFDMSTSNAPLINNGFWYLAVQTSPTFQAGGALMDFTINGNSIFTGAALGVGTNYQNDWTNYATVQQMASNGTYIGFDCQLTIY